jgi:hypothetical protein
MARYYFHMSNGGELVRDEFGEEFAREEDAHAHAVGVASELARNDPAQSMNGRQLIIMDETGRVVCNVPLPVDD